MEDQGGKRPVAEWGPWQAETTAGAFLPELWGVVAVNALACSDPQRQERSTGCSVPGKVPASRGSLGSSQIGALVCGDMDGYFPLLSTSILYLPCRGVQKTLFQPSGSLLIRTDVRRQAAGIFLPKHPSLCCLPGTDRHPPPAPQCSCLCFVSLKFVELKQLPKPIWKHKEAQTHKEARLVVGPEGTCSLCNTNW